MSIYVNLLKEDEIRVHKAVSKRFTIVASLAGGGGVLLMLGLVLLIQSVATSRSLAEYQERWSQIETDYTSAVAMQKELNTAENVITELNAWKNASQDWHVLLYEMKRLVPANIQLTRLNVRSSFDVVTVNGEAKGPVTRSYKIGITGKAVDDYAEELVVNFIRDLKQSPVYGEAIDSIKLIGMQADAASRDQADRTFSIEATTRPKEMKK